MDRKDDIGPTHYIFTMKVSNQYYPTCCRARFVLTPIVQTRLAGTYGSIKCQTVADILIERPPATGAQSARRERLKQNSLFLEIHALSDQYALLLSLIV